MTAGRPETSIGSPLEPGGSTGTADMGPRETVLRPTLLETAMVWLGCFCAVAIFALSMADIVLRAASVEFFLAAEANGILMAWMIFLAMAHVTRTRSHISIDFLERLVPGWLRVGLRVFDHLVMLGYVAVLSWYCGQLAWTSYVNEVRSSSILRWPVVYAQAGVLAGLSVLALTQCLILLDELRAGLRRAAPRKTEQS